MRKTSAAQLAKDLKISKARALEAVFKAQLIAAIIKETKRKGYTHAELARKSKLPRTAVTGILSGSLQKVTIDRILRLVAALGLTAEVKVKKAA